MTVEEAEHQMATRLYQNTARVHFNQFTQARPLRAPPDLWRARDFAGACALVQRARERVPHHGDQRRPPCRAAVCGITVFAWSEVLAKAELPGRRMLVPCACALSRQRINPVGFPVQAGCGRPSRRHFDLDYWALMPR